jgi:hypothetical protein
LLSVTEEDKNGWQVKVTELVPDDVGVSPHVLTFRVGAVTALDRENMLGIWIHHWDSDVNGNNYGPVLMDYKSWKKVNRHIRKQWRKRTWWIFRG